ncbi:MAG: glutamine--fructose-6-phosphate transaminase (isomerizing) [Clostridia bacterium]|nr:glutamine--fructose-6-phosphate transaminase (isomerizing) [Clostridia bacterium]
MCGIVGFTGKRDAAPILLDGLSKLEYRGYDSAGLAVRADDGQTEIVKVKGRLKVLREKTDDGKTLHGSVGIGHTRWATHGEPSESNAHPHRSEDGNVVGVHNGIIENYQELKEKLVKKGYRFYSATDTEIVIKLIDYYYKKYGMGPIDALAKTMVRVRGSYALAVMFKDYPGKVFAARKDSPMILGSKDGECFLASDVPAILKYTRTVYYIGNLEMAMMEAGKICFYNLDGEQIEKEPTEILWDAAAAEKDGYEHFMMKEIHEQPKAVGDTVNSLMKDGKLNFDGFGLTDEILRSFTSVTIVGCGSAFHVGTVGGYVIEDLCRIPVRVEIASEFRYRAPILDKNTLTVIISQSGETADSLAALREAKKNGSPVLGIVNVVGSSIARESDYVLYTMAGPEIAVATTKAYSTQLAAMYAVAIRLGASRGMLDEAHENELTSELLALPEKIKEILQDKERIQWFTSKFAAAKDAFFLGRGIDYAASMEGSLKMKEVSYIHSEAYAAGELKHGTISLIEDGTLVIGILTQDKLFEKTLSNMQEVKSRGGFLCGITFKGRYVVEDTADFIVYVPKTDEHFATSLTVIPMQLMGYYISVAKGLDVDKPRNLAKSVTVE